MTGFSIAINAWGVHTILHKALTEAEAAVWQAELRNAAERCEGTGRGWSVVADLRGLNGAAVQTLAGPALAVVAGRAGVERCAVITVDEAQAEAVGRLMAGGPGVAGKTRILAVEGRDRVQIVAAYGWALNGREPQLAHRPRTGVAVGVAVGVVVPFPGKRAAPTGGALRRAS